MCVGVRVLSATGRSRPAFAKEKCVVCLKEVLAFSVWHEFLLLYIYCIFFLTTFPQIHVEYKVLINNICTHTHTPFICGR